MRLKRKCIICKRPPSVRDGISLFHFPSRLGETQTLLNTAVPTERFTDNIPPYVPPLVEQEQEYLKRLYKEQNKTVKTETENTSQEVSIKASVLQKEPVNALDQPIKCLATEGLSRLNNGTDADNIVEHILVEAVEYHEKPIVATQQNTFIHSMKRKPNRTKEAAIISRLKAKIKRKNRIILKLFSRIVRMKIRRDKNFIKRLFEKQQHLYQ